MVRTQIQLPNELYDRTKRLAEAKEISLAELVRRGLEYMLSIHAEDPPLRGRWKLEPPSDIGLRGDPFADSDWRVTANMALETESGPGALMLNDAKKDQS